jgi:hypothetical protein
VTIISWRSRFAITLRTLPQGKPAEAEALCRQIDTIDNRLPAGPFHFNQAPCYGTLGKTMRQLG